MKTWEQFKEAVNTLLTVDAARRGMEDVIERWINQAVIDIQSHVPELRASHTQTYIVDDLTVNSLCLTGELPDGAKVREVYQTKIGTSSARLSFTGYPWDQRHDLKAGNVPTGKYLIAIDPRGGEFWIYPPIDEEHRLEVFWDGKKIDFEDADPVSFPEDMEQVVANWVSAQVARKVDQDLTMHNSFMNDYREGRRLLYVDAKDQARMSSVDSSPMPDLEIPEPEED